MIDADSAARLVRATARISAVILAVNLLIAARRLRAVRDVRAVRVLRAADVGTFAAFLLSHTIHFVCVALLTIATAGANITVRGGYPTIISFGVLFYVASFAVFQQKRRESARWLTTGSRRIELLTSAGLWLAFFQAFAGRALQWWFFAALTLFMTIALAAYGAASSRAARSIG